jgi:hypothetical protein
MKYPHWDDGSVLAKITKECAPHSQIAPSYVYKSTLDSVLDSFASLDRRTSDALDISASVTQNASPGKPNLENAAKSLTLRRSCHSGEITVPFFSASLLSNTFLALT